MPPSACGAGSTVIASLLLCRVRGGERDAPDPRRAMIGNMRLGSPLPHTWDSQDDWIATLRRLGFRTAHWPLDDDADEPTERAYADAAARADVVIAEIGVWNNPLSPDDATRRAAVELCKARLALADRVDARCCVNLAGTRADSGTARIPTT